MRNIISVDTNAEFAAWLDEIRTEAPPPKTARFDEDPVALGCAAYRIWNTHRISRWTEFRDITVTAEDREWAERVRNYYRARTEHILFDVLKRGSTAASEFRKKLALIVTGQMAEFTTQDRAILYTLPYFYLEDTALDRVFANNASADYYHDHAQAPQDPQRLQLTLQERILVYRKSRETVQYWFRSADSPALYQWCIRVDNPLAGLAESIVASMPHTAVHAHVVSRHIRHRDDSHHYNIFNLTLA